MAVKGIDISNHQGMVNWNEVWRDDVKFAFIKATEDIDFKDKFFARNWSEAKRVGIIRGAYHFARPSSGTTPEQEAYYFLDQVNSVGLEESDILILDMEDEKLPIGVDYSGWYKFWLEIVENIIGFKPMVYTGKWYLDRNVQSRHGFGQYPLWLSAYQPDRPPTPEPWTGYEFWQYTSKGKVRGVSGDCDINDFIGTEQDLLSYGKPKEKPSMPEIDIEGILTHLATMEVSLDVLVKQASMIRNDIDQIRTKLGHP